MPLHASSIADLTALQVPPLAAKLHAMHGVPHALLQQTPSAQKLLAHSPAASARLSVRFLRHAPAAGAVLACFGQGCVSEQPPAQIAPAHVFGAQSTVCAAGQAPLPSHAAASVAVLPVQLAARHDWLVPG